MNWYCALSKVMVEVENTLYALAPASRDNTH